ncbi:hypothetical protein ATKI12_8799 [Kitasatospora sp. Ki12]
MEFPKRQDLAELGAAEYEALASLWEAVSMLHVELSTALAAEDRARRLEDNAERRTEGARFAFEVEAFGGLGRVAFRCVDELETLVWRYASAAAVLGISVLERLAVGGPPLPAEVVERLCAEPTLAEFERAVAVPVDGLLNRQGTHLERHREERRKMLHLVETAYECLGDSDDPMDRSTAAGARILVDHPEHTDRPWVGLLDSLVGLVLQKPNEISRVLKG